MVGSMTPLARSFERLRVNNQLCRAAVGDPSDQSWRRLSATTEEDLDDLFAASAQRGARRADHLGASVASLLVDALVSTALPPLLVERRLPDVRPRNLWVRLHASEPWFEGILIEDSTVHLLPTDSEASDPIAVVVPSVADLHRRFAHHLVETVGPWFAAIRARAPFGRRGMWGQLADDLCGTALWIARTAGLDQRAVWGEAQAMVDQVAAAVPELRARPRLFPVAWQGREMLFQVKGTCCLWYTRHDDADTLGEGYCTTCPLRADDVRQERLCRHLAESAAG